MKLLIIFFFLELIAFRLQQIYLIFLFRFILFFMISNDNGKQIA